MPYAHHNLPNGKVEVTKADTGKKVGITTPSKLNAYLAALHMNSPENKMAEGGIVELPKPKKPAMGATHVKTGVHEMKAEAPKMISPGKAPGESKPETYRKQNPIPLASGGPVPMQNLQSINPQMMQQALSQNAGPLPMQPRQVPQMPMSNLSQLMQMLGKRS